MLLNTDDFRLLLTDIYSAFAPQKMDTIENIIEKYGDESIRQRNAIQMAFLKYVNSTNPQYHKYKHLLPEVGSERNILYLMESYSRGERMFSEETLLKFQEQQRAAEEKKMSEIERKEKERLKQEEEYRLEKENAAKKLEEERKKLEEERLRKEEEEKNVLLKTSEENSKKNQELAKQLSEAKKEIEGLNKVIDEKIKNFKDYLEEKPKELSAFEKMNVEIISFEEPIEKKDDGTIIYSESDKSKINLPPDKFVATFSIGQRFMTTDKEGMVVGIEVVNITDDYATDLDNPTRMINLKKL